MKFGQSNAHVQIQAKLFSECTPGANTGKKICYTKLKQKMCEHQRICYEKQWSVVEKRNSLLNSQNN
jgi:hypothetical protein